MAGGRWQPCEAGATWARRYPCAKPRTLPPRRTGGRECPNCAKALEKEINKQPSIKKAEINFVKEYITIDSTLRETKKGTTPANYKKIGDYPKLEVGDNTISWDGTVTKVIIQPNWRHKI